MERRLWREIKAGSPAALEELFRSSYALLYDYGLKLCGDDELVKDAIQEVYAYIWEKRDRLSVPDSVRAYLLAAERRLLLKMLKSNTRLGEVEKEFGGEQARTAFSAEDLIIDAETKEAEQDNLRQAFDSIPVRMREALYMKTYDNLSYREIAEIMAISSQVARNYVSEAFKRLRVLLKTDL